MSKLLSYRTAGKDCGPVFRVLDSSCGVYPVQCKHEGVPEGLLYQDKSITFVVHKDHLGAC